jgi:hypothetical protein
MRNYGTLVPLLALFGRQEEWRLLASIAKDWVKAEALIRIGRFRCLIQIDGAVRHRNASTAGPWIRHYFPEACDVLLSCDFA